MIEAETPRDPSLFTRMIANQDGSVYSRRCSAGYAVYREDQWQRPSKHTELES
jgi:hypothetical protein